MSTERLLTLAFAVIIFVVVVWFLLNLMGRG